MALIGPWMPENWVLGLAISLDSYKCTHKRQAHRSLVTEGPPSPQLLHQNVLAGCYRGSDCHVFWSVINTCILESSPSQSIHKGNSIDMDKTARVGKVSLGLPRRSPGAVC